MCVIIKNTIMCDILWFLTLAVSCANAILVTEQSERLTTGAIAAWEQYPFAVSLQQLSLLPNQTQAHRCGGAMITYQRALTAASCTYSIGVNGAIVPIVASQYRVYAGSNLLTGDTVTERIRTIDNYTIHPEHLIYPALLNDIAIITLTSPFLNTTVVPIPYATDNFIPADFTLCTVVGWGATSLSANASNELRYANKYIYNHNLCTTLYSSLSGVTNVHPNMLCAVSYDILSVGCTGDEGNALICNGQLAGILSLTNRCSTTSFPEIYTRVSNHTAWIRSITGGASTFKPELGIIALLAVVCAKLFS